MYLFSVQAFLSHANYVFAISNLQIHNLIYCNLCTVDRYLLHGILWMVQCLYITITLVWMSITTVIAAYNQQLTFTQTTTTGGTLNNKMRKDSLWNISTLTKAGKNAKLPWNMVKIASNMCTFYKFSKNCGRNKIKISIYW